MVAFPTVVFHFRSRGFFHGRAERQERRCWLGLGCKRAAEVGEETTQKRCLGCTFSAREQEATAVNTKASIENNI